MTRVTMLVLALIGAPAFAAEPAMSGQQVFEHWCAPCHGPGIGNPGERYKPGTMALNFKYQGKLPPLLTERTDLSAEYVRYIVRTGVSIMPFFRKTEITDAQVDALAAYLAKSK